TLARRPRRRDALPRRLREAVRRRHVRGDRRRHVRQPAPAAVRRALRGAARKPLGATAGGRVPDRPQPRRVVPRSSPRRQAAGAALAATSSRKGGLPEPGSTVACRGRACTVAFKGLFDTAQVAWITAFGTVWSIQADDEDDHFIRHLNVRLADAHSRRVAVFT